MKHTKKTDLLIIGAGPAGLTAADEAASKGAAIKVVDEAQPRAAACPARYIRPPNKKTPGPTVRKPQGT